MSFALVGCLSNLLFTLNAFATVSMAFPHFHRIVNWTESFPGSICHYFLARGMSHPISIKTFIHSVNDQEHPARRKRIASLYHHPSRKLGTPALNHSNPPPTSTSATTLGSTSHCCVTTPVRLTYLSPPGRCACSTCSNNYACRPARQYRISSNEFRINFHKNKHSHGNSATVILFG